jgi:hypothetical protein
MVAIAFSFQLVSSHVNSTTNLTGLHRRHDVLRPSAVWRLKNAIYLRTSIIHFARAHADVPALIKGRTTLVTRTHQYREAVHCGHPKAKGRRLNGGYRSAITAVTAFGGIPADLLAVAVDMDMGPRRHDACKDSRKSHKQDQV